MNCRNPFNCTSTAWNRNKLAKRRQHRRESGGNVDALWMNARTQYCERRYRIFLFPSFSSFHRTGANPLTFELMHQLFEMHRANSISQFTISVYVFAKRKSRRRYGREINGRQDRYAIAVSCNSGFIKYFYFFQSPTPAKMSYDHADARGIAHGIHNTAVGKLVRQLALKMAANTPGGAGIC